MTPPCIAPGGSMLTELLVIRINTWVNSPRSLELDLGEWQLMACQNHLPELQQLHVRFILRGGNRDADLSWLRTQSCKRLDVTVNIDGSDYLQSYPHAQAMAELQQLHADKVTLVINVPFLQELQAVCEQLSSPRAVCLILRHRSSAAFLYHLPGSPYVHMFASLGIMTSAAISWLAVVAVAHHVRITVDCGQEKVLMGFVKPRGAVLPNDMCIHGIEPWQLTISACPGLSMVGLPGQVDKLQPAPYMLQNNAAAKAGL